MARKLNKEMKKTPVVFSTHKAGEYFIGKLLDKGHEAKLKKGKKMVYAFALEESDMPIQIKDEKTGDYVDVVEIEQGAEVSVFTGKVLNEALQRAEIGERIKFTYLGLVEPQNGGNEYHNFDAEVL